MTGTKDIKTPGYIWRKWSEAAYKSRAAREGETFKERKQERVSFTEYGVTVAELSLKGHIERQHRISIPQTMEVEIGGGGGVSYLCGLLSPGAEAGSMKSDRFSGSST